MMKMYNPPHPGFVLRDEFIAPLGISVSEAASKFGVSRQNLSGILNGHIGISPNMALRIAKAFSASPGIWLLMQAAYDMWHAKQTINLDNVQVMRD
jgi:addiction module HigA family antidote